MTTKPGAQDKYIGIGGKRFSAISNEWADPLTAKEWDVFYPGVLDTVNVVGAVASIVMQLAYKPIGAGVTAHTKIYVEPTKRAATTFTFVAVALLGNSDEKKAYRRRVNRAHAPVKSENEAEIKYNAMDPDLQLWVASCIVKSLMDGAALFNRKPTRESAKKLYEHLKPLGTTLQVREDMWPADLDAFEAHWNDFCLKLDMLPAVRDELMLLVDLKLYHPWVAKVFGPFNRIMTTGQLPPGIRTQMGLTWTAREERKFAQYTSRIKTINRLLPRAIRQSLLITLMSKFRRSLRLSPNTQTA
jgi:uncharacterized protein (DUF2236 family)